MVAQLQTFLAALDSGFANYVVAPISAVLFYDVAFWDNGTPGEVALPAVVVWLVAGAIYFTLQFRFVNIRAFGHAIDCVRGRYTDPNEAGEISHFQALSAALSATVGLGNIAGVAVAVGVGGPGAIFWMVTAGLLGMSSKFVECSLGQKFRLIDSEGRVTGGPMIYLRDGLAQRGFPRLGIVLSGIFAMMCIGGSFGGGNMFQSNQAFAIVRDQIPWLADQGALGAALFGLIMAAFVGLVIVGGIRRIGEVAGILVPAMCLLYVASGLGVLAVNIREVPGALGTIVGSAFSLEAGFGGFIGVLIQGFRRAAFSNEAGVGSASIAHSAARTEQPLREGMVALLEPFIDTVVVCTMTGLVIVVSGAHTAPDAGESIAMTAYAFATVFPWFPAVLSITAVLFAFSTMISWSYYGEKCWAHLFGEGSVVLYKLTFLFFCWAGAVFNAASVLDFGDLMILGMAFPNILGVLFLVGPLKADLKKYMARLKAGEFPRYE
ncbi:MAG: alanine/glycine:cation symporter family protein [Myxococcota bacterium]|jgi:alanine or glycine:cation symporter, AGCS family|nr:alanine/glycine:cation symporter family protein [Myxococcota bacterium]